MIGTASPGNHEYLRSLGAEPTTYGDGLVERVRALAPDGGRGARHRRRRCLAALAEAAAGVPSTWSRSRITPAPRCRPGAASSGGADPATVRALHALKDIGELIEAGPFTLRGGKTFPLDQIADAHRLSESGHARGKLVLLVG